MRSIPRLDVAARGRLAHTILAVAACLGLLVSTAALVSAQTTQDKARARRANSPFNLAAGPNSILQGNLVQCGIDNQGNVCTDVFNSPTGGGGFWPSGTTNQYIFNSGLQIAGINGPDAGPWAGDTVGAYFFDARGTQPHGSPRTDSEGGGAVFNSLDPNDVENWPANAFVSDTSIFNAALIGNAIVSDQDSWVTYWDGDPNRISNRDHPMGIQVEQRSLAFNAPRGAEHTIFFIYKFTNVTNDPAFQLPNEQRFGVSLPDAGWTFTNIYAAFSMDPDVTTHATSNFSTAILPFDLGVAYHSEFVTDDFNFAARADLYAPPFFVGPGFVGVKYLRSPISPETGDEVGLTLFSNTLNLATGFPDPIGVKQLFRYLKGDVNTAAGDNPCNIANPIQSRLCFIYQTAADTRFYQSSGPFSLGPGESATIVVAYTHGAPVRIPDYTPGATLRPGIPSRAPGHGTAPLNPVERMTGLISIPAAALTVIGNDTVVDESRVNVVRGSLLHNAQIAQSIFDNRFLLPRPPEPPRFSLVPANNQVTVIWEPSRTEQVGDPFFTIASDPESPLYDPNYRQFDVEGYRIYRATGLSGGFEQIAQFDHTGTIFEDITGQLDPEFVPEEGEPFDGPVEHEITGEIIQFPTGGRIRDAVTGAVIVTGADTVRLENTGVPFAFVDRNVRNGITYRYIVTAFDVNSLQSGPSVLESPRQPQNVVPRGLAPNIALANFSSFIAGDDDEPLDPTAPLPTLDPAAGIFSGPMPPTNSVEATFAPLVQQLLPAFRLTGRIDSILPWNEDRPGGCPKGSNIQGACWKMFLTYNRDGVTTQSVADGFTGVLTAFGDPAVTEFPLGGAPVPADELNASKFALPAGFPGFIGSVGGSFPQHLNYSSTEGQYNRRTGTCTSTPNETCQRNMHGGSRWFAGENETLADPTTFTRSGQLPGIDTIYQPVNHTPLSPGVGQSPASTAMQCFAYGVGYLQRAADIRFTWGSNGFSNVRDVTHNVNVGFKPNPQATWGFFVTDANGNGFLDWNDFDYLDGPFSQASFLGFCGADFGGTVEGGDYNPARVATLDENLAGLVPVSVQSSAVPNLTQTGTGFGLYANGERYIFQTTNLPSSGTEWTLRSYSGRILTDPSVTLDANNYQFIPQDRPPMVPGLTVVFEAEEPTQLVGEASLANVHTVPDPFYVRSAFDLGPSNKSLRFVNLPAQAVIRIFTVNGILVRVLEHNDAQDGGETGWDLRNRNNQFVASGVYFYVVEAANGRKKTGRFTVVQFAR